ncbi:DUF1592 domain-containing protein, partial [Myxococcota bacterium]|nr:DUF1592 domain-containing protein [Myxococcota bacterium]
AFRRPVTSAEAARYVQLFELTSADEGFEGGVRWVITAMLQSPHFLHRPELGTWNGARYALDAWERASLLSYSITGTMPDAALFELARSGALMDAAVLEREARRLFRTPSGRANVQRFVGQWLSIDRLAEVPKDAVTYPELTPQIRAKMKRETERFVEHVVFEGTGTITELLTADYGFVDAALAGYYGISPPTEDLDSEGFGRVFRGELGYSGILTHGSLLTTHARASSTSPVHRGKVVRERLLCQPLPPPPPGIVVQPPPLDPTLTTRERYAAHGSVAACVGCHRVMDPIGFAFEHWDGIGRFRADEGGHVIDARGEIVSSRATDGTFDGTAELGRRLAASPEVSSCLAEEWARFAWGVSPRQELPCVTDEVARVLRDPAARLEDLAVAIATSVHARERTGPAPVTDAPPDAPPVDEPPVDEPPVEPPPSEPPGTTSPDLQIDVHNDATWETGFCDQVTVTNLGATELEWVAVVHVAGTLTQHWNSEADGEGGDVAFRGAAWNRALAPAGSTSFGYCASR